MACKNVIKPRAYRSFCLH